MLTDTQKGHMANFASTILKESNNLVSMAKEYEKKLKNLTDEEMQKSLEDIQGKLEHIGSAVNISLGVFTSGDEQPVARTRGLSPGSAPEPDVTTFSDFLADIGNSVVRSQEQLDQRSVEYLSSIQDRPYIPPTLFRIPKISASLKVGLEKKSSDKLNVLLYTRKSEQSELNQQSLDFEISAVPPSPELLRLLHDQTPKINFLFDRVQRASIFEMIKTLIASLPANDKLGPQLERIIQSENQPRVLIWPIEELQNYLILFAGKSTDEDVGVWFLQKEAAEKVSVIPIIRQDLKSKFGEDQSPLRKLVLDLGESQAKLLQGI